MRARRKLEHLKLALDVPDGPGTTGFEDVYLIPDSVPEINLDEIDMETTFLGRELRLPLIINAMTGGIAEAEEINRTLSRIAGNTGIGIAVGSQAIAVEKGAFHESFRVVRRENPNGLVLANISALADVSSAMQAVEMIEADGLQVHLNTPQELAMPEGERDFKGRLDNIADLVSKSPVPVIAKEVGFGLSREAASCLIEAGVKCLDVGGRGGTNFVAIENYRGGLFGPELTEWGIPTAVSLMEVLSLQAEVKVIASGGIRSSLQAAKALALGADLVGMAGPLLRILKTGGYGALEAAISSFAYRLKAIALMVGSRNLKSLKQKPVLVMGKTADWLRAREIDVSRWARR